MLGSVIVTVISSDSPSFPDNVTEQLLSVLLTVLVSLLTFIVTVLLTVFILVKTLSYSVFEVKVKKNRLGGIFIALIGIISFILPIVFIWSS